MAEPFLPADCSTGISCAVAAKAVAAVENVRTARRAMLTKNFLKLFAFIVKPLLKTYKKL